MKQKELKKLKKIYVSHCCQEGVFIAEDKNGLLYNICGECLEKCSFKSIDISEALEDDKDDPPTSQEEL